MAGNKLTDKMEMFCQEYIIDLNATQAAIRAGYSEKTAKVIACQNLTKLNVQERLKELKAKRLETVLISQEWVLNNLKDAHDQAELDRNHASRLKAIELAGKHTGIFTDRIDLTSMNNSLNPSSINIEVIPGRLIHDDEEIKPKLELLAKDESKVVAK